MLVFRHAAALLFKDLWGLLLHQFIKVITAHLNHVGPFRAVSLNDAIEMAKNVLDLGIIVFREGTIVVETYLTRYKQKSVGG